MNCRDSISSIAPIASEFQKSERSREHGIGCATRVQLADSRSNSNGRYQTSTAGYSNRVHCLAARRVSRDERGQAATRSSRDTRLAAKLRFLALNFVSGRTRIFRRISRLNCSRNRSSPEFLAIAFHAWHDHFRPKSDLNLRSAPPALNRWPGVFGTRTFS
jgi:hypothetical protein